MRNGYSAAQIRAAEEPHLAAGEPLMQHAAAALADEIRALLRDRGAAGAGPRKAVDTVVLLVGTGNNGGDALFAGASLAADGVRVEIVPVGGRMHEDGLAAATGAGARLRDSVDAAVIASLVAGADVVVDGILGTGSAADPALRGRAREIVAAILPVLARRGVAPPTAAGPPTRPLVVAVDIPSGIGADDGSVPDPTVLPADVTVTFGGYKAGLLMGEARRFTGLVRLVDIGLGPELEAMQPLMRG